MLSAALILSAIMGLIQEKLYRTHGKRKYLKDIQFKPIGYS